MTIDTDAERDLIRRLESPYQARKSHDPHSPAACLLDQTIVSFTAALDEIDRLRVALKKAGLARLEDELVKDVFAMSDAELEAELRESGVNIELFDKDMDDLVASALNGKETTMTDKLREALADLVSWFDDGPSSYGLWIIKAGPSGADDAVARARAALEETP